MNLVGTRYATFLDHDALVKCEDLCVPDRLPVRCYREALGARFASRLGFSTPPTELSVHPRHGRQVSRRWLADARTPDPHELASIAVTPAGILVLLLDLLVANHDRRTDNLLIAEGRIVPIDFNVAFGFASSDVRREPPDVTIMRWFGVAGALALRRDAIALFDHELARFHHLISEPYIHWSVAQLPDAFVAVDERTRLLEGLLLRRTCMGSWIHDWWYRTVAPVHRITEATDDQ